jgi:hypothetical protein
MVGLGTQQMSAKKPSHARKPTPEVVIRKLNPLMVPDFTMATAGPKGLRVSPPQLFLITV